MSSAPAYRYDHAATRPARHLESAPSVRVVPGRKHAVYPTLSDGAVLGIKAIIACAHHGRIACCAGEPSF